MPNDAKSYFRKEKLITLDDTNEQKKIKFHVIISCIVHRVKKVIT